MLQKIIIFSLIFIFNSQLSAAASDTESYIVNTRALKVRLAPSTNAIHSYSIYKNNKVAVFELKNGWARLSPYKTTEINGMIVELAKWTYAKYLTKTAPKVSKKEVSVAKVIKKEIKIKKKSTCTSCTAKRVREARVKRIAKKEKSATDAQAIREALREAIKTAKKESQAKETKQVKETKITKKEEKSQAIMPNQDNLETNKNMIGLADVISKSDDFREHAYVFMLAAEQLILNNVCTVKDFQRMRGWVSTAPKNTYFTYCGGYKRKNKIYIDASTGILSR